MALAASAARRVATRLDVHGLTKRNTLPRNISTTLRSGRITNSHANRPTHSPWGTYGHERPLCTSTRRSAGPSLRDHSVDSKADQKSQPGDSRPRTGPARLTLIAGVSLLSVLYAVLPQPLPADHRPSPSSTRDDRDPSLPRYRLTDIRKHDAHSDAPWVTSGDKVYDITDWVAAHPGGDVILQAAGRSIDPYWNIFRIHQAPHVREILAQYMIGLVDAADLAADGRPCEADDVADPFAQDPMRDHRLRTITDKPCNAEPPRTEVARDYVTPNDLFYVRNHMWVPVVGGAADQDRLAAAGDHQVVIELPDGDVRTYTLDELRRRFRHNRVTAVLQCSGNRRSDMTQAVGKTNGLQWTVGAISNAVWEGVLLRDVLADAGVRWQTSQTSRTSDEQPDLHVHLAGLEAYAASIPLATALDPRGDVLLAFGMNGQPLPRDHGFPLRAVVPGHVAARSVKWLSRIAVAEEESPSQWQRRDYKLFGPNEGGAPDWDRYPAIQEMPVTSAITDVWMGRDRILQAGQLWGLEKKGNGNRAAPGVRDFRAWQAEQKSETNSEPVAVTGYAYSGGGRQIVRVDVSLDGGRTWDQAELLDQAGRDREEGGGMVARGDRDWAWKRWRYAGQLYGDGDDDDREIVVKATDSAYNTQPERHDGIYNVRGNLATAWHRVRVQQEEKRVRGCGFEESR